MTELSSAGREQHRASYDYAFAPRDMPAGPANAPEWLKAENTGSITRPVDGTPRFTSVPERRTFADWAFGPPKRPLPKMTGYRVACGICWAFWTFVPLLGMLFAPGPGHVDGLILAGLCGFYDWRIWTLRARFLTILLIW